MTSGMAGIELLVDLQPEPDRDPGDERKAQDQGLALDQQVEVVLEVQDGARLVGRLKRQRNQDNVG